MIQGPRTIFLLLILLACLVLVLLWATPVSAFLDTILLRLESSPSNQVQDTSIVLYAENSDGRDPAWEKRYYYGLRSWGIRGSGSPESGKIWFASFPGKSGRYEVTLNAILEQDGSPPLRLSANDEVLTESRLPYLKGRKDCAARGAVGTFSLGTHEITQGSKISLWAESTYECGEKGAYMLWDKLVFRAVD